MESQNLLLGQYLSLIDFCTCTNTYQKYINQINPFPTNSESIDALQNLCKHIVDPIIDHFGREQFQLTYGFCSKDLKHFLEQKDPVTGLKNGRVAPNLDQHMAHEVNRNEKYYCDRLGAACDFQIANVSSNKVVDWILDTGLPFDRLYYYSIERPIHISYGDGHSRSICTFTTSGTPTTKGIEAWVNLAKLKIE
ncbi:hypothetical protein FNW02_33470 [Komarekiella sp. 'clone 1']|uniref:Peptidase M15A C-terminal domain-containing protein n=2 Tax=Komarekiella TaxID=2022127 RepID=A0AA40T424_9NOST|nr:hypothetical protein [Komarekiella delphini-convector SJRDD-AB1]